MLNLNQEQLKELLIKNGFRKSLNLEELTNVLAKIIEFNNFVVTKLPKEPEKKPEKIRVFTRKAYTEEEFIEYCYNAKRVFIDSKDKDRAEAIARDIIEKDLQAKINIIWIDVPELPLFFR